ncbi:spore germination protein [Fictibacillus macauensis ZFHKF-1]|uniref:Spore germination protein n=1 Tax=Fictibacillus macauensis ZFHKF-1 TaxID=1196324 RepID=I8UHP4_9BACL|nr:Ger(x)C family spore germination protein [Fictibacillus macauensis]EIT86348.1 spore germination protein [Fictibacillus macauensis ZFHKF-1]
MRKYKVWFITLLLLTACTPQKQVLEDIELVGTVGYDYASKDLVEASAACPIVTGGSQQATLENVVFSAKAHTSKSIRQELQAQSPRPFGSGRIGVILFEDKLAQKGITKIIDSLQRDPSVGRNIFLAVTEGKTKDMLTKKYVVNDIVPVYLKKLIEQNINLTIPRTNFHHFNYSYYGNGSDPFMPLLAVSGKYIKITGLALFDHSKYVDHISFDDSIIFKFMYQDFRQGSHEFKMKNNRYLTLENLNSKVKYEYKDILGSPRLTMHIKITGKVNDAAGLSLYKPQDITKIEKTIKKELDQDAERLVKQFQEKQIDPLGIGDRARSKVRNFTFKEWDQKYPTMPVTVSSEINITQSGIVE